LSERVYYKPVMEGDELNTSVLLKRYRYIYVIC